MRDSVQFRKITYPGVNPDSFFVSEYGDVWSLYTHRILSPFQDKDGYLRVALAGFKVPVHRLVAWQFIPETRSPELVVDHLDCNKQHNHYSNLEWVTVAENTKRAQANGLRNYNTGENNNTAKYSEDFVREICEQLQAGKLPIEIFRSYKGNIKVDTSADTKSLYILIFHLKKRQVWSSVTKDYDYGTEIPTRNGVKRLIRPNPNSQGFSFNEDQIREICRLHVDGNSTYDILEKIGIHEIDVGSKKYERFADRVRDIKRGKSWREISKEYFEPIISERTSHNIDRSLILEMMNHGYSTGRIIQLYGIDSKSQYPLLYRAICKQISACRKILDLGEHESITAEELNTWIMNQWAAIS